jgi:hypothetical protein
MKKTFLLLFSIGTLSTVFAQDGRDHGRSETREVILGRNDQQTVYNNRPGYDNKNTAFSIEQRKKEEIERVSGNYDQKMAAVQRDRHLKSREKSRQLSILQREKAQAIRDINARYDRQMPYGRR